MKGYYRFTNERRKFFKERFIFNSQSDAVHMSVANILPDSLNIRDITLSNKDVISWLDSNSNPSNEPRIPVVWIRQEWEGNFQIDILESTQKLVLQRFKISEEFYNYVGHPSIQGFFRFPDDKLGLQSFAIALLNHCLVVWTYDPCTAQVNIVCWGKKKKLETLKSAFRWSSQTFNQDPMLPVIFVMMAHKQWLDDQLDEQFHNLTKVESRTQFAGWRLREKDIPDGSHTTLTAKMGGTAASLALCERNCFLGIQILTSMSYYSQQGQNDPAKNDTLTGLTSWARVLQQGFETQRAQIRFYERRAEIQMQALFNIITQKDTQVSISIGEDSRKLALTSKEDSLAMKTIAAVTITFLPGTFVAALFAMPLFRWDPPSSTEGIVSRHFWIYWAVTLPLTIVVLVVWYLWTRAQIQSKIKNAENDRLEYQRDVFGREGGLV